MWTSDQVSKAKLSTLMIGPDALKTCLDMPSVIDAIEDAFVAFENGEAKMPPKSYIDLPKHGGDFRAMPAHVRDASGIKWVNVHPDNSTDHDLPTVMGTVIFSDPATGFPLAVMDGTMLTRYRTGAVAGVATRYLAPPDASSLGLLGAGQQARTQLDAIASVIEVERVVLADLDEQAIERFIEVESGRDCEVVGGSPEEVAGCDVISTTTPTRTPILKREWIDDGTHINAMGADAAGKQELESTALADAAVVVDDWEQCSHSGEINVPVSEGLLREDDVFGDLSEIVSGTVDMPSGNRITMFDSTGLAIQDIATARLVYREARDRGLGTDFDLVST